MPFLPPQSLSPAPGVGTLSAAVPVPGRAATLLTSLKSAASAADRRNPFGTGFSTARPIIVTGCHRVRLQPRITLGAVATAFSTQAQIAVYGAIGEFNADRTGLRSISFLQRLDSSVADDYESAAGVATNIPASPSTSNMIAGPDGKLYGPPLLFTDANGSVSPWLIVSPFNLLIALPIVAATGAGDVGELIATAGS